MTLERFDSDATFTAMFDWPRTALTELSLAEGDSVLMRVDAQGRQAAVILEGTVEQMTTTSLRVRLPKGLAGWGEGDQMSGEQHGDRGQASDGGHAHPCRNSPALWRVDRCEYGNSWGKARGALTRFFSARSAATEGGVVCGGGGAGGQTEAGRYAAKHRRLIVDLEVCVCVSVYVIADLEMESLLNVVGVTGCHCPLAADTPTPTRAADTCSGAGTLLCRRLVLRVPRLR